MNKDKKEKKKRIKEELSPNQRKELVMYSIQLGAIIATITCIVTVIATCYFFILRLRSPQRQLEEHAVLSDEDVHAFLEEHNIVVDGMGEDIIQYIQNYSIYDVGSDDLKNGIYKGIVESLDDPYSEYITYEENQLKNETDSGKFVGIGIRYQKKVYDNSIRVISVVPDGPAEKSGIRANDLILEVNDKNIGMMTSEELTNAIRGDAGSSVKIKIARGDEEIICEPIRAEVTSKLVEWEELGEEFNAKDRTVYLHLREFAGKAAEQVEEVCEYMDENGIQNLILDLRGNVGGDVSILEDIASNFIRKGKIAEIRGRTEITSKDVMSKGSNYNFNVVCLVDSNSASASEMLCGSLRDINDVILIGEKTFGKGIAQTTVPLNDGSALKLTTAEYYLYNGECIHKIGIEPDIVMEHNYVDDIGNLKSDEVVLKAVDVLNKQVYTAKALKNTYTDN